MCPLRPWVAVLSLLPAFCHAQVTYESPAKSVPELLKALTKVTGVTLRANAGFENVPLTVRFRDRSLEDVRAEIARAVLGRWVERGGAYTLERDTAAWQALGDARKAAREQAIQEALTKFSKDQAGDAAWDEAKVRDLVAKERKNRQNMLDDIRRNNPNVNAAQVQIMQSSTRGVTAATPSLIDAVRKMPAGLLAAIEPGQRLVFSTSPTRMQRPFPFPAGSLTEKFTRSHNMLAEAVKGTPAEPDNVTVTGGLDLRARHLAAMQVKTLLIVSRPASTDGLSFEMKFADPQGNVVGRSSRWIQLSPVTPETGTLPDLSTDDAVEFTKVSEDIAKAFAETNAERNGGGNSFAFATESGVFRVGSGGPLPAPAVSQAAMLILADPLANDPQSTFVSDGLLSLARANDWDLVASLPDEAVLPLARLAASGVKQSGFAKACQAAGSRIDLADKTLRITPAQPLEAAEARMDRKSAKTLYSSVTAKGYARLHALASFALALGPAPTTGSLAVRTLKVIDPYVADVLSSSIDVSPSLFQFLGTLQASSFEGKPVDLQFGFGQLNPVQKRLIERYVYSRSTGYGSIIGDGDMIGISISDGPPGQGPSLPTLADEPTEAMPNGLPMGGAVSVSFSAIELVKGGVTGKRGGPFLSAAALGGHLAFANREPDPDMDIKLPTFDTFVPSAGHNVKVQLSVTKSGRGDSGFLDAWTLNGAKATAFDALPAGFIQAVKKAQDEMSRNTLRFGSRGEKPPH